MRRLLASATLAAIGLTITVPMASAHNDPQVHKVGWGASPDPTTAPDGTEVWANDEVIAAWAEFNDGVKSWDVVIRPVNGGQPSTCHEDLALENNRYPQKVYINCPWDTTRAKRYTLPGPTPKAVAEQPRPTSTNAPTRIWHGEDLGPSVNGKYTIEITVTNGDIICGIVTPCRDDPSVGVELHPIYQSGSNPPRWREVYVVNGVAAPGGVSSAFDPNTNGISVTWAPNPEPDVSYVVQEKVGDGKWSSGVGASVNRYERTLDQPGKYQYRVAAVRPAPTRDNANATKKSDYVAASAVDVAQLTPPSTAGAAAPNQADGAPAGGDPGVVVPTDQNSPTPTTAGARGATPGKAPSRPNGTRARPAGSSSRPAGSTADAPGEAEGEGPDEGFSPALPYDTSSGDPRFAEDDGSGEEAGPQTLAGGVVPKPRDTRQLLIFMASALTLFVFAMQLTVLLRKSRPVLAGAAATEQYSDDFDDWLGF